MNKEIAEGAQVLEPIQAVTNQIEWNKALVEWNPASGIPNEDDLVGMIAKSEEEAFQIYNDYAYRMGFSVRYNKIRYRAGGKEISMRQFCCWKDGNKKTNGKRCKQYTKLNIRTGCKAYIQFHVDKNGTWTVTKHNTKHNHPMCSPNKRHLLSSHRKVPENDIQYIKQLSDSGVPVADAVRLLEKQAVGPLYLGYGLRDVYNKLGVITKKSLEGGDAYALINIFKRRFENETGFYYDFEIDPDGSLVSFFGVTCKF